MNHPQTPALAEHVEGIRQEEMVPTGRALVPVPPSLADLTAAIQAAHSEVIAGLSQTAIKAIKLGEYLLDAKKLVKHGLWQDFVTLDCGLKLSTAQMYMKLAAHKDELSQLVAANSRSSRALTQAAALKFLSSAQQAKRRKKQGGRK